ncbi:MAG: hypothetical protein AB1726_00385 [Planctomycetota bacterium]
MEPFLALLATTLTLAAAGLALPAQDAPPPRFRFRAVLDGPLSLTVEEPEIAGPAVTITGGDARCPHVPFTFDWGDGAREEGFFPARHTYCDTGRDYTVTVTAHYDPGEAVESVRVRFAPVRDEFARDERIPRRVRVAAAPVTLGTTVPGYAPPADLGGFTDADLAVPRAAWEYLLDVGHYLQAGFCNGDLDPSGGREQVVLCQPEFGGAFSLWFTSPVAMGTDPAYLRSLSGVSSLYHELGHNLTLNSPAACRLGGRTDGPMSTIVSETLAQIFQHATAWEILNHPARYGLGEALAEGVRQSALAAFAITARSHRDYVAAGCPFATRQGAGEEGDGTFGTFMTLAYVFVESAEERGAFRAPLQRTMALLQTFREADRVRYQERENDAFRATFLVAALSHGFERDLRGRFRALRFVLDDAVYTEMLGRMGGK